jgi:hypothetical protein
MNHAIGLGWMAWPCVAWWRGGEGEAGDLRYRDGLKELLQGFEARAGHATLLAPPAKEVED